MAVCNPLDLLKTRLQLEAGHARGTAGGGTGFGLVAAIVREEGAIGLWRGTGVSMLRSAMGSAAQLSVNARLQELAAAYMPPGAASDAVCALAAGGATVAVINPVDVVRTRLYSQPLDSSGAGTLYRGAADCVGKILAVEGPLAFYKVRAPPPA